MHIDELILLGTIIKTHGYSGGVVIALEGNFSEKVNEMELVFVEVDKKPVPFFIETSREVSPETVIVSFDYYDSDSKIREFVGNKVYSDQDPGVAPAQTDLPVAYKGYTLLNRDGKALGEIVKILSYPMQVMLEISSENSTPILIPFNRDWILKDDPKNLTLKMDLPEGLDDINT